MRPSWSNLNSSFEQWAFRNGLGRRLQRLEHAKLLERHPASRESGRTDKRLIRLTESGRLAALGGIDPPAAWQRPWDGRWRLAIFDLPEVQNKQRVKFRRALKQLKFGYLQNSVWLSPHPFGPLAGRAGETGVNVESLTLFEGRPAGGESDQDLVHGAWNFGLIQHRYDLWAKVAAQAPRPRLGNEAEWRAVRHWARREREAWAAVTTCDPFLPSVLLPAGYPGRKCWEQRLDVLGNLARALRKTH